MNRRINSPEICLPSCWVMRNPVLVSGIIRCFDCPILLLPTGNICARGYGYIRSRARIYEDVRGQFCMYANSFYIGVLTERAANTFRLKFD